MFEEDVQSLNDYPKSKQLEFFHLPNTTINYKNEKLYKKKKKNEFMRIISFSSIHLLLILFFYFYRIRVDIISRGFSKSGKMHDEFPIGLQGRMDQKEYKEVIDFLDVKKKFFN